MTVDTARAAISLSERRYPASPGLFERLRKHFVRIAARHQMRELDERTLRDIGLTRGDLFRGYLN